SVFHYLSMKECAVTLPLCAGHESYFRERIRFNNRLHWAIVILGLLVAAAGVVHELILYARGQILPGQMAERIQGALGLGLLAWLVCFIILVFVILPHAGIRLVRETDTHV